MRTVSRSLLISGAGLGALVFSSSAQALTKTLIAGPVKAVPGLFGPKQAATVNAFSQKQVTIHVGDSVSWMRHGFHTITFNTKGGADIPLIGPDLNSTYKGFTDQAGQPFWFNGQHRVLFSPAGAFPQGGRTEDGSKLTGSGLPLGGGPGSGPPKPYVLKFTKVGVFKYECVVHAGMEASVRVVPKGRPIPSARADAAKVAKAFAAEVKLARALASFQPPANTTTVSGGNDKGQVAVLKFFPDTVHVPVGGTVRFSVTTKLEPHTFTFGPAAFRKTLSDNFVTPAPNPGGPPSLVLNPLALFPSNPPPALPAYDGTAHGNGFFNTGILANGGHGGHSPTMSAITFSKAGTYEFECMIHPEMMGKVIVG